EFQSWLLSLSITWPKYKPSVTTVRCLTPAFSGAVNGIEINHVNCASRPPLQRLVRRPSRPVSQSLLAFPSVTRQAACPRILSPPCIFDGVGFQPLLSLASRSSPALG